MGFLNLFRGGKKLQVKTETTISVSVERVFSFLRTPTEHVHIIPGLVSLDGAPTGEVEEGTTYGFVYEMYGMRLTGQWKVIKLTLPTQYEACTTGNVSSYWTYRLAPTATGTHLSLTVDYAPPKSLLDRVKQDIIHSINQQSADTFMQNVKTTLEKSTVGS